MANSSKAANQIVRTVKVGVTVAPEHKEALEMRFKGRTELLPRVSDVKATQSAKKPFL